MEFYMKNGVFKTEASIISGASVVGNKEFKGPLGSLFDLHDDKNKFNQKTWEKAESEMQRLALNTALAKAGLEDLSLDAIFSGDLLNQCVGSAYGLLSFNVPYFGLYGACSTAVEGLTLASLMISGGKLSRCGTISSSHFCSAERQYRNPLEYGGQRTPTAQWTVTGAGAFIVGKKDEGLANIEEVMPGIVIEKGIKDANNMGAAMAPAALDTMIRYFKETNTHPDDYDAIFTGDLGYEGSLILQELMRAEGCPLAENFFDCGKLIFDREAQDVHSGGSGCGCSAVVLASYILPKLKRGELKNALLLGTGAMMNPSSLKQGLAIPAVAHLIKLSSARENS